MNAKKLSIGLFVIIFVLFTTFSFVAYDKSESVDTIICFEGSYAHKYAEENKIEFELISDSDAYMADLSLENFDYNFSDSEGEIVSYSGDSDKIAIPTDIDGYKITKICEDAFKNAKNLNTIYIPESVNEIELSDSELGGLKGITIYLYEDTQLYNTLTIAFSNADGESLLDIKTIPDSYYVNYYSANIPFSYNNISDDEIEITSYNADINMVCIPESIDGKTVTAISFDALELGVETIVIPESVTEIKTDLYTSRYDVDFMVGLVLALLAAIISSVFIATLKVDTKEKMFLTIPQVIIAYVGMVLGVIASAVYLFVSPTPIVIVGFVVIYGIGAAIVLFAKTAAGAVSKTEEKVKTQTFFIKALTVDADTLVAQAQVPEIKAQVTKVYEAIRYSDPMSNDALAGAETQITLKFNELQNAVAENDATKVQTISNELLILIKDRNSKCKLLK